MPVDEAVVSAFLDRQPERAFCGHKVRLAYSGLAWFSLVYYSSAFAPAFAFVPPFAFAP